VVERLLTMLIYGINPVLEALRAGRVTAIRVSPRAGDRVSAALERAEAQGIPVRRVQAVDLDRETRGAVHQGVVADVRTGGALSVEDLLIRAVGAPLIVVLDGIEDPHNLGAILRTVDAAGADGVVRQSRRAAALGGAAAKASAGAVSHVKIAEVVNIARAIEAMKTAGVWTVGLADDGSTPYDRIDYTLPTALVVGGEGDGLRRLVRDRCDWVASIPMRGRVQSLNVSVATGIVLFEAVRQRTRRAEGAAPTGLNGI
jgi:23S rRNA (guanosine2251-2'-O)-methyltransferase